MNRVFFVSMKKLFVMTNIKIFLVLETVQIRQIQKQWPQLVGLIIIKFKNFIYRNFQNYFQILFIFKFQNFYLFISKFYLFIYF